MSESQPEDDDSFAAAIKRANDRWFKEMVVTLYQEADSSYGEGPAAAIWAFLVFVE